MPERRGRGEQASPGFGHPRRLAGISKLEIGEGRPEGGGVGCASADRRQGARDARTHLARSRGPKTATLGRRQSLRRPGDSPAPPSPGVRAADDPRLQRSSGRRMIEMAS